LGNRLLDAARLTSALLILAVLPVIAAKQEYSGWMETSQPFVMYRWRLITYGAGLASDCEFQFQYDGDAKGFNARLLVRYVQSGGGSKESRFPVYVERGKPGGEYVANSCTRPTSVDFTDVRGNVAQTFGNALCRLGSKTIDMTEETVIGPRIPTKTLQTLAIRIPDRCRIKAAQKLIEWRSQDQTAWPGLSGAYCAAQADPGKLSALKREQAGIADKRTTELSGMICDCWGDSVKELVLPMLSGTSANPAPSPYVVPCTANESCDRTLPGSKCMTGTCQLPSALSIDAGKIESMAENKLKSATTSAIRSNAGGAALAFVEQVAPGVAATLSEAGSALSSAAVPLAIAGKVLKSTDQNTHEVGYKRTLQELQSDMDEFVFQLKGGNPKVTGLMVPRLSADIARLNEHAAGLQREREWGSTACYNVFSLNNSLVNFSLANLLRFTDSSGVPVNGPNQAFPPRR
jgi:hypothetical protein